MKKFYKTSFFIRNYNLNVIGVGKKEDIFNQQGITEAIHTHDNMDGVNQTINYMKKESIT